MSKKEHLGPMLEVAGYGQLLEEVSQVLDNARRRAARTINTLLTATYWEIGRHVVEFEQKGQEQAEYGTMLLKRLGQDLTVRFGRGFSWRNLYLMRSFYLTYPHILQTVSAKSPLRADQQTATEKSIPDKLAEVFPLSWSHYVCLLAHADAGQMNLYLNYLKENEALDGEEPPIGLILCAEKDEAVAHYALGGLSNQVFASRYRLQLPDPDVLSQEIEAERRRLEQRVKE